MLDVGDEQVSALLLFYCFFTTALLLLLLLANSKMLVRALIVLEGVALRQLQQSCNRAATALQQRCNSAATEHATAALIVLEEDALPDATRFTTAAELQQSCNRACLTRRHALYCCFYCYCFYCYCFYCYCFYCYCFTADLESPVRYSTNEFN